MKNSLFKLHDWFFRIKWVDKGKEGSTDVVKESKARELFDIMKDTCTAELFVVYKNGYEMKIA